MPRGSAHRGIINLLDMHINEPLRVMVDFESHVSDDMTVLYNVVIMKTANSEILNKFLLMRGL